MTSFSNKPVNSSRPFSTPDSGFAAIREYGNPHRAPDREERLYAQWERSAGRTLHGRGGSYRILQPGKRNSGPGPDYLGALVAFPDGQLCRGDVEIHLQRAGWYRHSHQWDPRYSELILHVTAYGPFRPVELDQRRWVPTVLLPAEGVASAAPCELIPSSLARFSGQKDFLRTLATQRWYRRLAASRGRDTSSRLQALARRLGTEPYRHRLLDIWRACLPAHENIGQFVGAVIRDLEDRPNAKLGRNMPGRAVGLSALACTYFHRPLIVAEWSLEDVRDLMRSLEDGGLTVPTDVFLIEVVGNWLLPLATGRLGADRFDEWFQLPLGWYYGRAKRFVAQLGLHKPVNFGEQQGLLEWMETLCRARECDGCPVTGAVGGF